MDKEQEKFFKKFGENVRKVRLERGLTLEDMQAHGFSPQHFQKVEKGIKAVNLFTVYRIKKAFKCEYNELIR